MIRRPGRLLPLLFLGAIGLGAQGLPGFHNRSGHSWHLLTLEGNAAALLMRQEHPQAPEVPQKLTLAPGVLLILQPGSSLYLGLLPERKGEVRVLMALLDRRFRNPWGVEILLGTFWGGSPGDLLVNTFRVQADPCFPCGPLWLHLRGLPCQGRDLTLRLHEYPGGEAQAPLGVR